MTASVTTEKSRRTDAAPVRGWLVVRIVLGLLAATAGTSWIVVGRAQLGTVLLTQVGVASETLAPTGTWVLMTAATATGLALLTAPTRPAAVVDRIQLVGGLWVLLCTVVLEVSTYGLELTGPSSACVYAGCWPGRYQDVLVLAPLLLGSGSMIVMSIAGRRAPRWLRGLVPGLVLGALATLQVAVWDGVVLPVLSGPPPF